ncbi:hypothetical protein N7535_000002 [Penicillium sp. DV-2018c]|nr:hypothetical protein N7461_006749 [Penicillium sp. DV-2018c]KAJ5581382.1 hypothetical protein N7535_000002 [Penicillium sp. DV-2018c]
MVNRGRSGGCVTCKQRRVRCDEAKPECQACHRLKLHCGGYNRSPKYAKLKFKDQNHKFCTKTNQDVNCHSHHVTATSGRWSEFTVQDRKGVSTLTTRRISEPDTAVQFYLSHYASMGRDMGSTRGFLNCSFQPICQREKSRHCHLPFQRWLQRSCLCGDKTPTVSGPHGSLILGQSHAFGVQYKIPKNAASRQLY